MTPSAAVESIVVEEAAAKHVGRLVFLGRVELRGFSRDDALGLLERLEGDGLFGFVGVVGLLVVRPDGQREDHRHVRAWTRPP